MPKKHLRRLMLDSRKNLSLAERTRAGMHIQHAFLATDEYNQAGVLALYAPIHNEVGTDLVMRHALSDGKLVLFPAVCGHNLVFRQVVGGGELHRGAFGIREPSLSCPIVSPAEADLLVVPGVAFDLGGRRIGYGKGFYDKTLHSLEGSGRLVSFCYDFQLVEEIAGEPHDVTMDMIVTESRVVRLRSHVHRVEVSYQ